MPLPAGVAFHHPFLPTPPVVAGDLQSMPSKSFRERPRVNVLGVGVDAIDLRTAVTRIFEALNGVGGAYVCVTGVHGVMEAQRDPELRRIINNSLVTTPDGMPMVWLGRLAGFRNMTRVYGPDLMLEICSASVATGSTHYLYGGNDGVAEELAERLRERFPGIRIVGTFTPPFRPLNADEEQRLSTELHTLRPDFFWVGLSTPKQERFMASYRDKLAVKVMLGVGAAFDIHSGKTKQAPSWMQHSGLEWFFRLLQEPRRLFKRYAVNNPAFLWRVLQQKVGLRQYSLGS